MKKSTLIIENVNLHASQIHKFRGFVGNLFLDDDLVHNHDLKTGKPIYRYPLIQFKMIDNKPVILALTDQATSAFAKIFMKLDEVDLEGIKIPIFNKSLKIEEVDFGFSETMQSYRFASPWIGLNQKNYGKYKEMTSEQDKTAFLERSLTGNILSISKGLGYWLEKDQRIIVEAKVQPRKVNLKGKSLIGFFGTFRTNFLIPDFVGLGKSVSRGFGTVRSVATPA